MKGSNRDRPDGQPFAADDVDDLTGKTLVGLNTEALLNALAPEHGHPDRAKIDEVVRRLIQQRPTSELRDLLIMAVHEGVEDIIKITDEKHRVLYVNRAYERRTGYRLDEIRGREIGDVLRPDEQSRENVRAIKEALLQNRTWSGLILSRRKDGQFMYCDTVVVPLNIDGQPRRHLSIARDLTTRRNVIRQLTETRERLTVSETSSVLLKRANDELRRVERLKDEFVSVVSHELRTPITAIHASLRLLDSVPGAGFSPDQERLLAMARRNTARMITIVNDMLTVGKLESGQMTLDVRMVCPAPIVTAAVAAIRSVAESAGVRLLVENTPCESILCDPSRIEQAVANLLANAIRFTPLGGTITAKVAPIDGGVRFSVMDEGAGIAESQLDAIFERFRQAEGVTTRVHGGTGLGLAIVKSIAEIHEGSVGVESTIGVGSHFWIDLPAPNLADEFAAIDRELAADS